MNFRSEMLLTPLKKGEFLPLPKPQIKEYEHYSTKQKGSVFRTEPFIFYIDVVVILLVEQIREFT